MPRNVRNFYLNADIDGYQNNLGGGPRRKEDGMSINITQRDEGEVMTAVSIMCYRQVITQESGKEIVKLITSVRDKHGKEVYRCETYRD